MDDFKEQVIGIFKFGGIFLLYLFLEFTISMIFELDIFSKNYTIANLSQITGNLIILVIFIFIYRNTFIKEYYNFKKDDFYNGLKYWTFGYIVMIVSTSVITALGGGVVQNEAGNQSLIDDFLPYAIFAMCIYAPIVEELIFRKTLRCCFKNPYTFAITSGLIFGGLHILSEIINYTSLINILYIIPYGALGFFFALSYYKTNNIFSTISVHALHNTIAVLLSVMYGG